MKKILLSIVAVALAGSAIGGATVAFYGDSETSTGNTFVAGSVELRVDSESHYNGMVCTDQGWQPSNDPQNFGEPVGFPVQGSDCEGSWSETDLQDGIHKFFYFTDLKPGDHGEDTISLHVIDNDAWGQFVVSNVEDYDNSCTEPEIAVEGDDCDQVTGTSTGEIDDNLLITAWLDQGATPGFQCGDPNASSTGARCDGDPTEGDNIYQSDSEGPLIWDNELISNLGPFNLSVVLGSGTGAYTEYGCSDTDGDTDYGNCHGLAEDGRMVGSATYYFGLAWDLDLLGTGNEVQSDSYTADLTFQVEQHRNNPNPFQI